MLEEEALGKRGGGGEARHIWGKLEGEALGEVGEAGGKRIRFLGGLGGCARGSEGEAGGKRIIFGGSAP